MITNYPTSVGLFFVFALLFFFFLLNFDDAAQVLRTLGFAGGA
jgi:hypothetical protein